MIEADLLHHAHQHPPTAPIDSVVVSAVIAESPELSFEQAAMVEAACAPGLAVTPIAGRPGAGKTYVTEAVVAAGVPIIGCAVSATAAAELERAAGFDRSVQPATTLARLLVDLHRHPDGLPAGVRIVVDEASMVGTRELHRLAVGAGEAVVAGQRPRCLSDARVGVCHAESGRERH